MGHHHSRPRSPYIPDQLALPTPNSIWDVTYRRSQRPPSPKLQPLTPIAANFLKYLITLNPDSVEAPSDTSRYATYFYNPSAEMLSSPEADAGRVQAEQREKERREREQDEWLKQRLEEEERKAGRKMWVMPVGEQPAPTGWERASSVPPGVTYTESFGARGKLGSQVEVKYTDSLTPTERLSSQLAESRRWHEERRRRERRAREVEIEGAPSSVLSNLQFGSDGPADEDWDWEDGALSPRERFLREERQRSVSCGPRLCVPRAVEGWWSAAATIGGSSECSEDAPYSAATLKPTPIKPAPITIPEEVPTRRRSFARRSELPRRGRPLERPPLPPRSSSLGRTDPRRLSLTIPTPPPNVYPCLTRTLRSPLIAVQDYSPVDLSPSETAERRRLYLAEAFAGWTSVHTTLSTVGSRRCSMSIVAVPEEGRVKSQCASFENTTISEGGGSGMMEPLWPPSEEALFDGQGNNNPIVLSWYKQAEEGAHCFFCRGEWRVFLALLLDWVGDLGWELLNWSVVMFWWLWGWGEVGWMRRGESTKRLEQTEHEHAD